MTNYDYLIVGGGMASAAPADRIHEIDVYRSIGFFSTEPDPPYNLPPF